MKKQLKGFIAGIALSTLFLLTISATHRNDFDRGESLEVFFNIFRDVNLMYVDSVDSKKMVATAANAMLDELDPYTEYMPKEEYDKFAVATSGKYGGMGAIITKSKDDEYAQISEIFEGFGAHKAGLVAGDKLLEIDSNDLKGLSSEEVSNRLKGDPGSLFKLKIKSWLTDSVKVVEVKRQMVTINPVSYYSIVDKERGVGYVSLLTFSENSSKELTSAIKELEKSGNLKSLILDLRNNGGGILDEAVNIVSLFVDKGTEVVSMGGKMYPKAQKYYTRTAPIYKDLPLMVLINGNSASASEIVAGALQDLDRAVIMGSKSFGKGLVQTTRPVGAGGVLKVTTAKYYIPSGRCIQAVDFSKKDSKNHGVTVVDSLRKEFKTKGGRIVKDGGGITPDIEYKDDEWTQFTSQIVLGGYDSNFAKLYFKRNHKNIFDIATFSIDDNDIADFVTFLKDEKFKPTSSSEYHLKKLKESAKKDRYNKIVEANIASIEKAISLDIAQEVKLNHDHIKTLLEIGIVTAFYHQKGKAAYIALHDKELKEAIERRSSQNLEF